jgi:hypothetical protein
MDVQFGLRHEPGADPDAVQAQPIFLHGLWRSGTTFVWSCFRKHGGTYCFYEPLHHGLAKLTRRRIERESPTVFEMNRHPTLSAPYFAEFAPLVRGRGVQDHRRAFAYERWSMDASESHPVLERYIESLLTLAWRQERAPVLGFTRSSLRIGWMKRRFGGFHLAIRRSPQAVWASFRAEQSLGNNAYFLMALEVAMRNAAEPDFAPLAESLRLPKCSPWQGSKRQRLAILERLSDAETFRLVYWLHCLAARHASVHADLVLDLERLAEVNAADAASAAIRARCGLDIDLRGCKVAPPRVSLPRAIRREVESSVERDLAPRPSLAVRPTGSGVGRSAV